MNYRRIGDIEKVQRIDQMLINNDEKRNETRWEGTSVFALAENLGKGTEESILNNGGAQQIRSHSQNKGKFKLRGLEIVQRNAFVLKQISSKIKVSFYPVQLWISRLSSRTIGPMACNSRRIARNLQVFSFVIHRRVIF